MLDIYQLNFAGLIGLCSALFLAQKSTSPSKSKTEAGSDAPDKKKKEKSEDSEKPSSSQDAAQWPFLVVFCLVMGSDWLQGPFLYSLYRDEHGIPPSLISTLFTTGFLSGAVTGSFAGKAADTHGRKRACLFFCLSYSASCVLTMVPSVPFLFAGRVLGGVGTSLLFSVFDSWMVTDFHARKLGERGRDLSQTFGLMSTLNSLVAIASGVFSEWIVSVSGTRKSPFVASVVLLAVAGWLISTRWTENYGELAAAKRKEKEDDKSPKTIFNAASSLTHILSDPRVLALGLASTMFEGSMYLFVFYWSPALNAAKTDATPLPYGIIFASFMASVLVASLVFNLMMGKTPLMRYTVLMIAILAVSNLSLIALSSPGGNSEQLTFWLFCLFEACVGMYWPCMGYLKGRLIEDGARAQVYSVLRIPLNLFVVASLLLTGGGDDAYGAVFSVCSKLLMVSCAGLWAMLLNEETVP